MKKSSGSKLIRVSSHLVREAHEICRGWLESIDRHIAENLKKLTCNDIKEIYYYSLFAELKRWRSSSNGFTGFSEFLVFRSLFHTIGEIFVPVETGNIATDPIVFRSQNYEIGQNVRIKTVNKRPDIYVKHDGELASILQVKTVITNVKVIDQEVETFKLFQQFFPSIRGLFIVLIRDNLTTSKEKRLKGAGYRTLVLDDNPTLISDVLKYVI